MTKYHLIGLGIAGAIAIASLFSPHVQAGLGFATAIATGVFGHAQGTKSKPDAGA